MCSECAAIASNASWPHLCMTCMVSIQEARKRKCCLPSIIYNAGFQDGSTVFEKLLYILICDLVVQICNEATQDNVLLDLAEARAGW